MGCLKLIRSLFLVMFVFACCFLTVSYAKEEAKPEKKKQLRPAKESYVVLDSQVKMHQGRIIDRKKRIQELADKKAQTKDPTQIQDTLNEMIVQARELKESFVEFQKQKKKLLYEYPEKGDQTERQYKHFEIEMVEEFNSMSNIDLRLKGALDQMEKAYEKPPEVVEMEKQRREKLEGRSQTARMAEPKTTVKQEPSPTPNRPKLSY